MRRSSLLMLTVLGSLICLIGSTGLFAALTDTARTGTNSVDSGALAASADIQIATGFVPATTPPNNGCGTFSEELATGFFAASGVGPGYGPGFPRIFCLRNVGSQPVTLTALATELVDLDFDCTGDEEAFDETCGGNKAGELATVLSLTYYGGFRCVDGAGTPVTHTSLLSANAVTPAPLGSLAPGETKCYNINIAYPSATPAAEVQGAQTDRVTWRITFTAQS